jgi:Uma2 family endonuclease
MADPVQRMRPGHFTYSDYLQWPSDERWELIDGVAYDMSAAPSLRHQRILGALYAEFRQQVKDPCEVLISALDVRLPESAEQADDRIDTVVQPDILVVCDPTKLDDRGCTGAPDLVVEVFSPHTAFKDQTEKLRAYERHGVREYWIVNPVAEYVLVFSLGVDGTYGAPASYRNPASIESRALTRVAIDLARVYPG